MREEKSKRASPSRNSSDSTHLPGKEIEEGHLAEREQGHRRLGVTGRGHGVPMMGSCGDAHSTGTSVGTQSKREETEGGESIGGTPWMNVPTAWTWEEEDGGLVGDGLMRWHAFKWQLGHTEAAETTSCHLDLWVAPDPTPPGRIQVLIWAWGGSRDCHLNLRWSWADVAAINHSHSAVSDCQSREREERSMGGSRLRKRRDHKVIFTRLITHATHCRPACWEFHSNWLYIAKEI